MKRLVIRISVLVTVVVLGVIAIAQCAARCQGTLDHGPGKQRPNER